MNNLSYKLIENYNKIPQKVCLIQDNKKITYKDLYIQVANFKEYLEKRGIKKGQKILVLVPMSIELYISLLAIWAIGAIPSFMDAGFIKNGMKRNKFDDINAIIGISKYILYSNINKNLKSLPIKINVKDIKRNNENIKLNICEVEKDFPGILTYTSGTTGVPKIASRSHEFLLNQGEVLKNTINYEDVDIEISTIPIFTLSNINAGITTVIAKANFTHLIKSKPIKILKQIENNNVNRIMAAPGILEVIINYCEKNKKQVKNIEKIFTGGGAIYLDFINKMKKIFPNAEIVTLYGSTEAEPIAELNIKDLSNEDIEKTQNGHGILAGKIVGVKECKIINPKKKEIGNITKNEFEKLLTTEIGEIVVTGDNVLKGYVNGIGDAENKFSVEGVKYHRTGDMGYIDEFGRLWLMGRIKTPYFNIEAALHSKFTLGKIAVLENNGDLILVVERNNKILDKKLQEAITFRKIKEIKYVKKIPVDKRHNTKVDYNELIKILKIKK